MKTKSTQTILALLKQFSTKRGQELNPSARVYLLTALLGTGLMKQAFAEEIQPAEMIAQLNLSPSVGIGAEVLAQLEAALAEAQAGALVPYGMETLAHNLVRAAIDACLTEEELLKMLQDVGMGEAQIQQVQAVSAQYYEYVESDLYGYQNMRDGATVWEEECNTGLLLAGQEDVLAAAQQGDIEGLVPFLPFGGAALGGLLLLPDDDDGVPPPPVPNVAPELVPVTRVTIRDGEGEEEVAGTGVVELEGTPPADAPDLQTVGTITFNDSNPADTHSIQGSEEGVLVLNGDSGRLEVAVTSQTDAAGNGGVITYTYFTDPADLEFLAEGEEIIEEFPITLVDSAGATSSTVITIRIVGTNDTPVVTAAGSDLEFSIVEGATADSGEVISTPIETAEPVLQNADVVVSPEGIQTFTGVVNFNDVDVSDIHDAEVLSTATSTTDESGEPLGVFQLGMVQSTDSDTAGQLSYTYVVNEAALNKLSQTDVVTETYTIRITDNFGAFVDQVITVTIQGSNDLPTLVAAVTSGEVTEIADGDAAENESTLTDSGTIQIADLDENDTYTVTTQDGSAGYLGEFTAVIDQATKTATWTFEVEDSAVDFLRAGDDIEQTYTVSISDGRGGQIDQTVTITITGTNDAPTIGSEVAQGATLPETNAQLTAAGSFIVQDVDTADSVTASVASVSVMFDSTDESAVAPEVTPQLLAGFQAMLSVSPTAILDSATNTANLAWNFNSGVATFDLLAAGESITLEYTVVVQDDSGQMNNTGSNTVTIVITGTNDGPVVNAGQTDETGAVTELEENLEVMGALRSTTGEIAFSDRDFTDSHTITVESLAEVSEIYVGEFTAPMTLPGGGIFSDLSFTRAFEWKFEVADSAIDFLAAGETKKQSYEVTVDDGNGGLVTQVVEITITGTNDAPTITSTVAQGDELDETNEPLTAAGSFTVADVDVTDVVNSTVSNLTVDGDTGGLTMEQLEGFFSVTPATVLNNMQTSGTLNWSFDSDTTTFDYLGVDEELTLVYTVQVQDDSGQVNDKNTANVTIIIKGTNDAPVAMAGSISATEDQLEAGVAVNAEDSNLLDTATDVDNPLTDLFVATVNGSALNIDENITVTLNYLDKNGDMATQDVQVRIQPEGNYFITGFDFDALPVDQDATGTITYQVGDGLGGLTEPLEATITISGTNDKPMGQGDELNTDEDEALIFNAADLLANDTDVDTADAELELLNVGGAMNGTVSLLDGVITFTPDENFTGEASFTYTLGDGDLASDPVTVIVNVGAVNDPAVITGNLMDTVIEAGDAEVPGDPTATGQLLAADPDNADNVFQAVEMPAMTTYGTFTITAGGLWTYTLNNDNLMVDALNVDDELEDSFDVFSEDGTKQTIEITITGTNDSAMIAGKVMDTVTEAGDADVPGMPTATGTVTAADVDNADNVFQPVTDPVTTTYGTFTITAGGLWTYTLDNTNMEVDALNVDDELEDSFVIRSEDGTEQTIEITITGTNDSAIIAGKVMDTVTEAGDAGVPGMPTATGTVTAADVDNADNVFQAVEMPAMTTYGTFTITAGGLWTYTLNNDNLMVDALNVDDELEDSFDIFSEDGTKQTIEITITGTNDSAVIDGKVMDTVVEAGDAGVPGTPTATGTVTAADVDNADNVFQAVEMPAMTTYGTFTITAGGLWTYTLDNTDPLVDALNIDSDPLMDSFDIFSEDGTKQTISITIDGTNDSPVISVNPVEVMIDEDQLEMGVIPMGNLLTGATDVDDAFNELTIGLVNGSADNVGTPVDVVVMFKDINGVDMMETIQVQVAADGTYEILAFDLDALPAAQLATGSFKYQVTDPQGGTSEEVTVNIEITGTDDTPRFAAVSNYFVPLDITQTNPEYALGYPITINIDDPDTIFSVKFTSVLPDADPQVDGRIVYYVDGMAVDVNVTDVFSGTDIPDFFYLPPAVVVGEEAFLDSVTYGIYENLDASGMPVSTGTLNVFALPPGAVAGPVGDITEGESKPLNSGKSYEAIIVFSEATSGDFIDTVNDNVADATLTLLTDYQANSYSPADGGPNINPVTQNGLLLETDLLVTLIVDGITFTVVAPLPANPDPMRWEYSAEDDLMRADINFANIVATIGGMQVSLAQYVVTNPLMAGDAWTIVYEDTTQGSNQARNFRFEFTTDSLGNDNIIASGDPLNPNTMYGGSGNDVLTGGNVNDEFFGREGNDQIFGLSGDDRLVGGGGDDTLDGGAGSDILLGGTGNDMLNGGEGADTLVGGDGADTFVFDNLDMADVVSDFDSAEMDKIDFGGALAQFDNTDVAAYVAPPVPVLETDPVNKFDMTDGKVYLVDVDFTDFESDASLQFLQENFAFLDNGDVAMAPEQNIIVLNGTTADAIPVVGAGIYHLTDTNNDGMVGAGEVTFLGTVENTLLEQNDLV